MSYTEVICYVRRIVVEGIFFYEEIKTKRRNMKIKLRLLQKKLAHSKSSHPP